MEVLTTSFRDAAQLDQIVNFIADHRHGMGIDVGGDATGAAQ